MTLPAFAADRCAAVAPELLSAPAAGTLLRRLLLIDISSVLPAGHSAANPPAAVAADDRRDRQ